MREFYVIMISWLLLICTIKNTISQHETIPYASVNNICEKCICLSTKTQDDQYRHVLSCPNKGLHHILPRWPEVFGINHEGMTIQVTFSENKIPLLQQLPASRGKISFSCTHCQIKEIQSPTFLDCPNIFSLNLGYNQLNSDSLNPDIFRGQYNDTAYEPIGLEYLDLSYNLIDTLDLRLFEHTPKLRKLLLAGNKFYKIGIETMHAIGSVKNLEYLDLSSNNLKILPREIFVNLIRLESLFIQDNQFEFVPDALNAIAGTLQNFDISANLISHLNVSSFDDFVQLKYLNISSMETLIAVEDGTFATLKNLKELFCNNNANLFKFHLPTSSRNLIIMDISNCNLKSLILDVDLLHLDKNHSYNFWPNLKLLNLYGNPWNCDCNLMNIFEQYKNIKSIENNRTAKCSSPSILAGTTILELNTDLCEKIGNIKREPQRVHTPYFLRPRSIGTTIIMLSIVIALGTIVGFGIVFIRQRLKNNLFGLNTEIRYTNVRNI